MAMVVPPSAQGVHPTLHRVWGQEAAPPLPPRLETVAMDEVASWRASMDDVGAAEMDGVEETVVDDVGIA
jgi:hypothetical protein